MHPFVSAVLNQGDWLIQLLKNQVDEPPALVHSAQVLVVVEVLKHQTPQACKSGMVSYQ